MTTEFRTTPTPSWETDILGDDFQQTTFNLGKDPDGEADIVAVVVKYQPLQATSYGNDSATLPQKGSPSAQTHRAVLWVHGMSDYFFQSHIAEAFYAHGRDFYAVDLRKCGRALRDGQTPHHISDLEMYDIKLNRALDLILAEGHTHVTIAAHSTGGLITALWLDRLRRTDPQRHAVINALVLDSPWLDMHLSPKKARAVRILAPILARLTPNKLTPDSSPGGYGKSLHKDQFGEWDYNVSWKPLGGHTKNWAWLAAIVAGHKRIGKGIETGVPTLSLHSDGYLLGRDFCEQLRHVDAVLNTDQIEARTPKLSSSARSAIIEGAMHDVYLSQKEVRARAFAETFAFLAEVDKSS